MRNIFILWFSVIFFSGCASTPPLPTSVVSKPITTDVISETVTAVEKPTQKVTRPKATGTEEDARRHFLRGMAALEIAKTKDDLVLAIDEFCMATEISPKMAIAWYNMGKAQEQYGLYGEAMESYSQYLDNAPDAPDAQNIRDEIVKLEFRQEQLEKSEGRTGTWVGDDGTFYSLTVAGNRLTLKARRYIPKEEVHSSYPFVPTVVNTGLVPVEFQLILQGNRLSGKWTRESFTADKCQIPADASEVTGELIESEGRMVLSHQLTMFNSFTQMSLLGSDSCGRVEAKERKTIEVSIYGPQKRGGLGVDLNGFTSWWDGGFSAIQFGWSGRLGVTNVKPGSPAYEAGLRDKDEILAIDGVAVKELSAGQAWMRLGGDPGTPVTLEIWRKSGEKTSIIKMNRVEVSKQ